jgi:SAM-dependent methyltransferase
MGGKLIEAEHCGRYWWAARLAAGTVAIDVGCGSGYGAEILAASGAVAVSGVDLAAEVVASAQRDYGSDAVSFVCGDAAALPFEDGSFDLAVCFEVIEHLPLGSGVIEEMHRVLRPGGLAVISSPNPAVYPPGNLHHLHEYDPDELLAAVRQSFASAALYRQSPFLTAAILERGAFDEHAEVHRKLDTVMLASHPPAETYAIVVAGDGELPVMEPLAVIGSDFEVRWWQEQLASARESVAELQRAGRKAAAEAHRSQRALDGARTRSVASAARVLEVEEQLARAQVRAGRLAEELEGNAHERDVLSGRLDELEARVKRADGVIVDLTSSISWKLTGPLRLAKRVARRALGRAR